MKIHYKNPLPAPALFLLRAAGYAPFTDPKSGEESFVRRLAGEFYPRFHLYVKEAGGVTTFDLHLDQKKPSYEGSRMHAGEYDGPLIEAEMTRIKSAFRATNAS